MPEKKSASFKLRPVQLRWRCDPDTLGIETTDDVPPCEEIIGQERAIRAIETGLNIQSHGYNIYVSGLTGTGKTTTVKKLLEKMPSKNRIPGDICYVNNFTDPDSPSSLVFPAGQGRRFARDMEKTILSLRKYIPQVHENDRYKNQRKEIIENFKIKTEKTFHAFEEKIKKEGFTLVQVQAGLMTRPEILPVMENQPIPWQKIADLISQGKLNPEEATKLRQKHDQFMEELQEIASTHQEKEKEIQEQLQKLEQDATRPTVEAQIKQMKKKYPQEKVSTYLDQVKENILNNLDPFKAREEDKNQQNTLLPSPKKRTTDPFLDYKVNVLVDNSCTKCTPIIIENAPTYTNLFGMIERSWDPSGVWRTDFTKIKAGSFLRANGGYLVFNLIDAVAEPGVWKGLKRTLKNNQAIIQSIEVLSPFVSSALKPEPIDISLKVLVIGNESTYRLIYDFDDEFKKIFKIRADFDTVMDKNKTSLKEYTQFACKICQSESLLPINKTGMAAVLEYGVSLAGRQSKISTRFSDIADIIREAHYWAGKSRSKTIGAAHIDRAIREKKYRLNRIEEKIQELIDEGVLMIDIRGRRVGQVNGLSVYSLGDYSFGRPSKITAEVAMGRSGIINIERESGLGGRTYNKGVLIISGYLRRMYAQDKPLTMSASLCFEQSYSGVDGDSASSTEIYGLLSALSDIPLRQDIAVTGSVNQKGEIQPIGGVNEKIEGYFAVCKAKGLTGEQGVMIPIQNLNDLMLDKEVVEAVNRSKFHIWSVRTIDQGIEILTGVPAGKRKKSGRFPEDTVHGRVDTRLTDFAEQMKKFGRDA
jgi:ATP-dependent Lon protease